ncbi:uncharacterized protein LOC143213583 [Lasioglossum baleicum]|uniref:uncharacterized protein LOC143213583 n=1 Tax=Lasioglossum baleicum TaxID=434251 RepID=UPI003FCCF3C9
MSNATNYPSCIKIPATNSKQNNTMVPQKSDLNETLALNRELITLANRVFGEGKWNHSVTNQTVDFVESFMGKYICGCVTFVKIQLHDGTFHEDMAYFHAEGATKGLAVHSARIVSLTEAFKKVLSCFSYFIEHDIEKLLTKPNSHNNNSQKESLQCSIPSFHSDMAEADIQSSPFKNQKTNKEGDRPAIPCSKSPSSQEAQISVPRIDTKSKSPTESTSKLNGAKSTNNVKCQLQSDDVSSIKEQGINRKEQEQKKELNEEELLRMERKRKQMEKQAEFKRLMKEKEQQKSIDSKKPNPKY